jgi:hypothetical protein
VNASLNEIEGLCKKAARGAGLSWGLAEEAGRAARWLSAHGLDGPQLLSTQLRLDDGCSYSQLTPETADESWQVPGQAMCSLIAGVTLSDHAYLLRDVGQIQLRQVSQPQLLLPFISAAVRQLGVSLQLSWPDCVLEFALTGEVVIQQAEGLLAAQVAQVTCTYTGADMGGGEALNGPLPALDSGVHDYLNSLAERTYVPASEASRLLGAGAGLSDNI